MSDESPSYRRNIIRTKRDIRRLPFALLLDSTVALLNNQSRLIANDTFSIPTSFILASRLCDTGAKDRAE